MKNTISKDIQQLEHEISQNQKIIDNSHSEQEDKDNAINANISLKAQRDSLLIQIDAAS